jgi:hypothetical protein
LVNIHYNLNLRRLWWLMLWLWFNSLVMLGATSQTYECLWSYSSPILLPPNNAVDDAFMNMLAVATGHMSWYTITAWGFKIIMLLVHEMLLFEFRDKEATAYYLNEQATTYYLGIKIKMNKLMLLLFLCLCQLLLPRI